MEHWDTTRGLKHYLNNCITLELSEKNQIVTQKSGKSGSPAGFFNRTRSSDPAGQSGKKSGKTGVWLIPNFDPFPIKIPHLRLKIPHFGL